MADITARGMAARAMTSGGGGGGGTTVDAYSKNETDNLLRGKANASDVYTSQQTDDLLDDKVDKISGKGLSTNDYTNEDMSLVKTISNKANTNDVNASITNLQNQISETSENVDTINTELMTNAGYSLGMSINPTTFELTMTLKNSTGGTVSSQKVDLPIESMVIDASYANGKLNLTLQNGTSLSVDISSIVSGLVKDTFKIAGIDMKDNIEANELRAALGVYTTTEVDNKLGQKANASTTYSKTEVDNKVSAISTNVQANTTAINATNERVTQNESDILKTEKSTIINQSTIGFQSKNILPNVQPSTAHEGITYTVNADKSITCNGTTGSTASYFSLNSVYTELPDNVDVVFSGCPAGGSANTYALQLYEEASPISKIHWNDYGGGLTGKLPKINNGKYKGTIVIRPNQTVKNLTFYPMLRYAGTDDTYEPYIPTVNERIIEAENNILSNTVTIEKIGLKAGSSAAVHLSAVGWYRAFIAERKQTVRSGILMLNRAFNAAAPESYTILFNLTHSNSIFRLLSKNIEGQGITKIRLVYSNTTPQLSPCYIDIYYNSTSGNTMTASAYCESIAATGAGSTFANSRFVVSDFSVAEIPEGYKAVEFDLTGKDVFERLTALETALSQTTE